LKLTRNRIVLIVVLVLAAALIWYSHGRIHFNWRVFVRQLRAAEWSRIAIGLGCIYFGYILRSIRWVWLVRHQKRLPLLSLLGTQVIGFTAVALIGRVADLVRPYLVSRKTDLSLGSQIGAYVVERLFDAGSMALIVSLVILLGPAGAMPHPEVVRRAAILGLALTTAGALFLVSVRLKGEAMASLFGRGGSVVSKRVGVAVEEKVQSFHRGLDTLRSFGDFAVVLSVSVAMWLLIALAYLETCRAFVASPVLGTMTAAQAVLLMIISGGVSVFQLPVLMWFTQIGGVAAAISSFFGVAPEPATGCAATLVLVTSVCIIPVGLVWARFERISLLKVATESEHAGEELVHHREPSAQQV
jgi:hypothetical protein